MRVDDWEEAKWGVYYMASFWSGMKFKEEFMFWKDGSSARVQFASNCFPIGPGFMFLDREPPIESAPYIEVLDKKKLQNWAMLFVESNDFGHTWKWSGANVAS